MLQNIARVSSIKDFMYKTYGNTCMGIVIAFMVSIIGYVTGIGYILMIPAFIILLYQLFVSHKYLIQYNMQKLFSSFMTISICEGIIMTPIYHIYGTELIITAFLMTGIIFGTVSIYGYLTDTDLSKNYLGIAISTSMILLISIPIMMMYSFFAGSELLNKFGIVISVISALLSSFYIAYSTQMLKDLYYKNTSHKDALALFGAIQLLIHFISLFRNLLHILHNLSRKE